MTVKAISEFYDKVDKTLRSIGDEFEVDEARAKVLVSKSLVEKVADKGKPKFEIKKDLD